MNISIDGQTLEAAMIVGSNLEEILREIQEHHLPPDRVVGDVLVNGHSYSEDLPHAAVEVTRGAIQSLELHTRTGEEIARHFLANGALVVTGLVDSLPKITEIFRLGDEEEANEHFLRFLETLQLLLSMLHSSARILGLSVDEAAGGNDEMMESLERISKMLSDLIVVQERSDWVYLADILEYELSPELSRFRDLLPRMTEAVH